MDKIKSTKEPRQIVVDLSIGFPPKGNPSQGIESSRA